MGARRKAQLDQLAAELRRAHEAGQAGNYDEAAEIAHAVVERTKALGVSSPFALWHVAIAADNGGKLEMAIDYISRVLQLDPLDNTYRSSFGVIVKHVRAALASPERAADDPSTPRLYELLVRAGEADVCAHAAMARYWLARGDTAKAVHIADAVTLLNPTDRDAWLCRAEVARAAGDPATAQECLAEAAAVEGEPVPFSIPGVAAA
jgi:tetratricopeptide (TPR) repeat protein